MPKARSFKAVDTWSPSYDLQAQESIKDALRAFIRSHYYQKAPCVCTLCTSAREALEEKL